MLTVQPEASGKRQISTHSHHPLDRHPLDRHPLDRHPLDEESGNYAQLAERLIDIGILRAEWRAKLVAFGADGWSLTRQISRISGVEAAFVAVAELAPAWPGGPVFGAAAFDNTVIIDEAMREFCAVSRKQFQQLLEAAYARIAELVEESPSPSRYPDLRGRTAILVDDGLSTPLASRAAIAATRNCGAQRVVLVAPAAGRRTVQQLANEVDLSYCGTQCTGRLMAARQR